MRSEEIKLELTRRIKEKQIDFVFFKRAIEDCRLFLPEKADFINNLRIGIDCNSSVIELPLFLLLKMKRCSQIFAEGKMGSDFEKIPFESVQWALNLIDKVLSENKAPLVSAEEEKKLQASDFKALQLLHKDFFDYTNEPMKTRAIELCSLTSSFPEATLLTAAAWAISIRCRPLFNRCAASYCGNETSLFWSDDSYELRLSSLRAKPLSMLKAIGSDHYLHIDVEADPNIVENPWVQIVEACPNLDRLTLYLEGAVPFLESLPLAQLPKLSWLTIRPSGAECWKSLSQLKIPHTIEHLTLFGTIDDVKEAAPYPFFRNLPPKNLDLSIDLKSDKKVEPSGFFSSWWSAAETDPIHEIFANLSHCVELELGSGSCKGFEYVIRNNRQLKKLKVCYHDGYPKIENLHMLLDSLTVLETCKFEIRFFRKSQAEDEFEEYLRSLRDLRNCNLKITLGGSYDQKLERLVNNLPQKDHLPTLSFNVHYYS